MEAAGIGPFFFSFWVMPQMLPPFHVKKKEILYVPNIYYTFHTP